MQKDSTDIDRVADIVENAEKFTREELSRLAAQTGGNISVDAVNAIAYNISQNVGRMLSSGPKES